MGNENPLVSICIPTYNGEEYLAEALQSAIDQTYRPLEIIVSDDASKDKTLDIVAEFQSKTDIPIHVYHHQPAGIGANWNNCVAHANGEYIKFLFQDDILLPQCVEKMVELALKDNEIGLVFCRRNLVDEIGNEQSIKLLKRNLELFPEYLPERGIIDGKEILKKADFFIYPQNIFGEPTAALIKADIFSVVGCFSMSLKQKLDAEYWYKACRYCKVGFLFEKLVTFRINEKQATNINSKQINNKESLLFYKSMILSNWNYISIKMKRKLIYNLLKRQFVYFYKKLFVL